MLDMRYCIVNIGYRIHRISYRKCAYEMVYDIICLYYVDIQYPGYQESRCTQAVPVPVPQCQSVAGPTRSASDGAVTSRTRNQSQ